MNKLSIEDLDLDGQRLLLRVDFNVPLKLDSAGESVVDNDERIRAALPTIRHALGRGAAVILMSHLGRPKGQVKREFSLAPVRDRLEDLLGRPVAFATDCVGPVAEAAVAALSPGEVLLLENLRFHPGEEKPAAEPGFAEQLAGLGDRFANDAFGTAHRADASMVAVAERFPRRAAGFLLAREIDYFSRALSSPARPFVTILGGAKVADKIGVLENLLNKVDALLIGGAMAYTFMRAQGVSVGASRVESEQLDLARRILKEAVEKDVDVLLPIDHVCGETFDEHTTPRTTGSTEIPDGWMGLDIGPGTLARFAERIALARTVIWNGPMGVFEWEAFAAGTLGVARACSASSALTIVGGGDSVSAVNKSGLADRFSHVSTGGGASLELLEGKTLPGIAVLTDK